MANNLQPASTTRQAQYFLTIVPPTGNVSLTGSSQIVERLHLRGTGSVTLSVPGQGPVNLTLTGTATTLEPLGRYDWDAGAFNVLNNTTDDVVIECLVL